MNSFTPFGLYPEIIKAISELGFENPTPIQSKTVPHLLSTNQDLIASAQTGTGKTAAFGLPSIQLTHIEDKSTQTLVLCPTRELCVQIAKDLGDYSKYMNGINILAVYGGASIQPQLKSLKKGAQIVIGTPGRTKDLIKRNKLKLSNVSRVVLDEADEMLTMGFKEDLEEILATTPKEKQTLLFSATMSKKIISITKKYMNDPLEVSAGKANLGAENVEHIYYMVQAKDRYEVLKRIADINPNIYGIVFCRTRRETKDVSNKLMHDGYNADAIHGELSQGQRDEVMGKFRKRQLQILVATDVAARGLDVNDLTHIINYNLPDDSEIYTHRSGRTGRAGKDGISIAIIHTREIRRLNEIENISGIRFSKKQVPNGIDICQTRLFSLIDKIKKVDVDEKQIAPFLPSIYEKLSSLDREELIQHFVSTEFNRYLSYYKNARDINTSGKHGDSRSGNRGKRTKGQRATGPFTNFYINVGYVSKLNPARLIGLINESLGSSSAEIGHIDIKKTFSFFEIEKAKEAQLMKGIQGKKFEGRPIELEISQEKPEKRSNSKDRSFNRKRGKRKGSDGRRKKRRRK
ncbi:MAG: DEAD/DEAH box helicase [Candidatus Marinimicrobia bacterium]|nr:DEAD/DEAH box helicase [Candidatus Neomarinimicrobiota bacterium]MBL7010831.1 DEAD/DEAH box helicase [Candidatus Neomarinimicrobiota bacterium]MBL7030121.1 DEAD/DEAH box helicase [Candidatus Neomarinimicrobiota bacterium]